MIFNLFDFSDTGIFKCKLDGTIIDLNKIAFSIFDISDKFNNITDVPGASIFQFCNEYKRIFDRVYSDGNMKKIELAFQTVKSNHRVILNSFFLEESNDNKQIINVIVTDITENKKIEKKLTSIIDLIPDIVYRLDNNGIITFISERVKKYGYNPDDLIGTKIIDIVHPDDRDKIKFRINERRTGERRTKFFEVRLMTKNRDPVSFQIENKDVAESLFFSICAEGLYTGASKENVEFIGTQGIARDITKRRYSELALKLSEGKYFAILNNLHDGYYEIGLDGRIIFVNNSLCKFLGFSKDELIGNSSGKILPVEKFNPLDDKYKDAEYDELRTKIINWTCERKDGKSVQLEGSLSLLRDNGENPISYIGIARDITAKRKMEMELFRARKLEAIGIFSGGIAHDYNNALTAIIGNISLAKMEIDNKDDKLMEILSDAEEASLRVRDLTQQLSSFSKGGKPDKAVLSIPILINDVAESVFANYKGFYEISIADDISCVEVDEFQIGHVLEYIFTNSIESITDSGNISITAENIVVEKEESHHEISLRKGKYVKISVRDNGIGIAEENITSIFDPYFSTKDFKSGMGLAISYAIIKRHHGYINVKSREGAGSTFSIYLPV